ncbi:MAG: FHA domain-containing protein [Myxococcota bacterium]
MSPPSGAAVGSSSQKAYALKFISGKYQGGEYPLKSDKQVVIGRSSELDMVLVEDMVSRKHAKITFSAGKITIEDLGSTNGTFVNGEKIKQARLKEGDRILIGTSILKLVHQGANAQDYDDTAVKQRLEEAAAVQAARATKASSMTGKIEEIPLPDLLQLFHTSKKNGVLVVKNDREGRIYLRQGKVYYAVIDANHELGPQKSFYRIITWDSGDFELQPPDDQQFMVELDSSTEALLMDALRQLDEYKRIQGMLPPGMSSLTLAMPMAAPLRELNPDQLDVLQLVHNYGGLEGVLDHSDKDDVVVAEILLELVKRDFVRAG